MAQNYAAPPINVWPGRITQIIDPHYFWMHFGTNELLQQFEILQQEIQAFCEQNWTSVRDSDQLDYGQVVLVDSGAHDGSRFKRGQITRQTGSHKVDVFYVDYGLTEVIMTDCICACFPSDFKKWPPQAVRCSLAGILPISKNWTSRATKTFQRVTDGKLFKTLVLYGAPGFCEVSLYPSDSDNGRSVSHELLDEDVAMPLEGTEVPEYFSQVMEFLAAIMPQDLMPSNGHEGGRQAEMQAPSSSSVAPSKPTDRYVPPQRKNQDFSLNTSFVPNHSSTSRPAKANSLDSWSGSSAVSSVSPKSNTAPKHSPKGQQLNMTLDKYKPVNDFYPFDNMSTYPPTPTSPLKSPSKQLDYASQNSASGPDGSYFSRSPVKHDKTNMSASPSQHYSPSLRERGGYSESSNGLINEHENKQGRHHDHRFAANLNKLPSPGRQEPVRSPKSPGSTIGSSLLDGQNAAANLEPSYLNSAISDRQGTPRSPKSNSQTQPTQQYRTDPRFSTDGSGMSSQTPFYPPNAKQGEHARITVPGVNHQYYNKQGQEALVPPGFYASPSNQKHADQVDGYRHTQTGYSNDSYNYGGNSVYRSPKKDTNDQYYSTSAGPYSPHSNTGTFSPHKNTGGYSPHSNTGAFSPQKNTGTYSQNSNIGAFSPQKSVGAFSPQSNSNYNSQSRPQLKVRLPETPTKPIYYEKRGKMSPASPDSANIEEFNIGDLEQSVFTSSAYLNKRVNQERLMALQEEAENIAAESKEQAKLLEMARYYGASTDDSPDIVLDEDSTDIFQQIAEEITSATNTHSKEFEELKRSPIKKKNKSSEEGSYIPPKLESIPADYFMEIDFAEAVKEALDFSQKDSIENAKVLIDGILESMKSANVEKQLYDVLMLMLAKAIKDYNQFHTLIMDAINSLNNEMEIKECLSKVLKRQQELCIRLPVPHSTCHLNCSKVMGHMFVITHDWSDSNSTVQDVILASVEKWILFNNKGSQIGQTEKEIMFLDCFGSFWEVAGFKLMDHNYGFKTRIQTEVKKKLLNENVSRPVREKLLDILLDLASQRSDRSSVHTQTITRTMIPSSCQVKPSQATKGVQTKPLQLDDDECMLDEYTRKWEFLSSNNNDVSNDRDSSIIQDSSSEHVKSSNRNDSTMEISFHSTNADISIYQTPNASMNTESDFPVNDSLDKSVSVSTVTKQDDSHDIISSKPSDKSAKEGTSVWKGSGKSFSSVIKDKNSVSSSKPQTMSESKSAKGCSIVDWFDYEPEREDSVGVSKQDKVNNCVETNCTVSKSNVGAKEKESLKQYDGSVKYPEAGKQTSKSAKMKKSKSKQSSLNNSSIDNSPVKECESHKADENRSSDGRKSIESCFNALTLSDIGDHVGKDVRETGDRKISQDTDWWGREDATNMTDNIYIDTGPDVIIDREEEVCVSDMETKLTRGPSGDGFDAKSENVMCDNLKSKVTDALSRTFIGQEEKNKDRDPVKGESLEQIHHSGAHAVVDDFAFETDSDDDLYEDGNDDNNDFFGAMSYEEEFPKSDLKQKVVQSFPNIDNIENSYDTDFPNSNLRDYLPPAPEIDPLSQPRMRWVPRKRICLNCHDDNHTTENCPKGFLLLQ